MMGFHGIVEQELPSGDLSEPLPQVFLREVRAEIKQVRAAGLVPDAEASQLFYRFEGLKTRVKPGASGEAQGDAVPEALGSAPGAPVFPPFSLFHIRLASGSLPRERSPGACGDSR